MPNKRTYKDVRHSLYGLGYRIWEHRGWYVDHYARYHVRVVDYVAKDDGLSYLVLFIPNQGDGVDFGEEWRSAMGTDWLAKAAAAKQAAAPQDNAVQDEAFQTKYPALYDFMTRTTRAGQPRELCKLQVFADAGQWKASLHDPNTEHSLFLTLSGPTDVFKAVEKALTADAPDWRSWGKKGTKKR